MVSSFVKALCHKIYVFLFLLLMSAAGCRRAMPPFYLTSHTRTHLPAALHCLPHRADPTCRGSTGVGKGLRTSRPPLHPHLPPPHTPKQRALPFTPPRPSRPAARRPALAGVVDSSSAPVPLLRLLQPGPPPATAAAEQEHLHSHLGSSRPW